MTAVFYCYKFYLQTDAEYAYQRLFVAENVQNAIELCWQTYLKDMDFPEDHDPEYEETEFQHRVFKSVELVGEIENELVLGSRPDSADG